MYKPDDNLSWVMELECPPVVCNDVIKKILRKGVMELLWDNLASAVFSSHKVIEMRKNILLYNLKQNSSTNTIHSMKQLLHLETREHELQKLISAFEKKYDEQHFLVKQKAQHSRKTQNAYVLMKLKKDWLTMKHNQTNTQLRDCTDMRLVSQHLMPNAVTNINESKIKECHDMVVSLCLGGDKKQVREKVSNMLGSIDTLTLWNFLYQSLSQNVNKLINSSMITSLENLDFMKGENNCIGIAKVYGEHICLVSRQLLYDIKAYKHQEHLMEFIQQIEIGCTNSEDISDWLALVLEVRKLGIEQTYLQQEVNINRENMDNTTVILSDMARVTSDIQCIGAEIIQYTKDLQQSLVRLKSAAIFVMRVKEKLHCELQKIFSMQIDNNDAKWLSGYLNTELKMYYDVLNLNALRRVMLKGDVKTCRHNESCINSTCVSVHGFKHDNLLLYFPIVQIPIYSLIQCYKHITMNVIYKKNMPPLITNELSILVSNTPMQERNEHNTLELLQLSKIYCGKAKEEINLFNATLCAWDDQTIQTTMVLTDISLDDLSFTEWLDQYNLLLYMIQNHK